MYFFPGVLFFKLKAKYHHQIFILFGRLHTKMKKISILLIIAIIASNIGKNFRISSKV